MVEEGKAVAAIQLIENQLALFPLVSPLQHVEEILQCEENNPLILHPQKLHQRYDHLSLHVELLYSKILPTVIAQVYKNTQHLNLHKVDIDY